MNAMIYLVNDIEAVIVVIFTEASNTTITVSPERYKFLWCTSPVWPYSRKM